MDNEISVVLFWGFVGFIVLLTVCIGGTNICNKITCESKASALGYKYEYGFWHGCVLEKPDGKRVLLEQLRDFDKE